MNLKEVNQLSYNASFKSQKLEIESVNQYIQNVSFESQTLGDDLSRVEWRTKQNLDYAYLMMYAEDRGRFYLQLEDDVLAAKNFVDTIIKAAKGRTAEGKEWFDIHFFVGGFIGKLFRSDFFYTFVVSFCGSK